MNAPQINLWFADKAEEAARFYTNVFGGEITKTFYYGKAGREITGGEPGSVFMVYFTLRGMQFIALNGGEQDWKFNSAISVVIPCDTQEEIDHYWADLTANGGQEVQCGWLTDKYGLSWQITPTEIDEMVGDPNDPASQRAMEAMLKMVKIDKAALEAAYRGEA